MLRREVPLGERLIGIGCYYTSTKGVGGRLRRTPSDFSVEEISTPPGENSGLCGSGVSFELVKEGWDTHLLLERLARELKVPLDWINISGTKDKRAVTRQRVTIRGVTPEEVAKLSIPGIRVENPKWCSRRTWLGEHTGNRFKVKITEISLSMDEAEQLVLETLLATGGIIPNFFGHQRFGSVRPNTHRVGWYLLRGDIKGAVHAYLGDPQPWEPGDARRARTIFDETHDYAHALEVFPRRLVYERRMLAYLRDHPGDYVGALRRLPRLLVKMFVHAYQSFLFNRMLTERIIRGFPLTEPILGDILVRRGEMIRVTKYNLRFAGEYVGRGWVVTHPLVGCDVPLAEGEPGMIEREVLEGENVELEWFNNVPVLNETFRGVRRVVYAPHWDTRILGVGEDDSGVWLDLSFVLPRGAYGTVLLREIMKCGIENY